MNPEHRMKISLAKKGKMPKFIPDNRGVTRSIQVRKQISETLKSKGIKPPARKGILKLNAITRQHGYKAFMEKRRELKKRNAGGKHTFREWQELKAKNNFICLSCRNSEPTIKLTEDHIIPISKGGNDSIENIQPLCFTCNLKKNTKIINFLEIGK